MLTAVKKGWFSWSFTISEGTHPIADVGMSRWREAGETTVQGIGYRMSRAARFSGDFLITGPGTTLARAQKPSPFSRTFEITHDGERYVLRKASLFSRGFVLLKGRRQVGSVSRTAWCSRSAAVDLPADLPLPVQVFIVWLVFVAWRRSARAAAAAG